MTKDGNMNGTGWRGRRGWVRALLIGSLMLNLAVAGVVIGGLIGHDRRGGPPLAARPQMNDMDGALGPLGGAFTREDRALMRQQAEGAGTDLAALRTDLRRDIDALARTLEADPWNPDAVRQQLTQMRQQAEQRAELGEEVMLNRLGAMSIEERRKVAQRLKVRFERALSRDEAPQKRH